MTDTGTWRPPPADPGFRGRGLQIITALAADVDLAARTRRHRRCASGCSPAASATRGGPRRRRRPDRVDEPPTSGRRRLATSDARRPALRAADRRPRPGRRRRRARGTARPQLTDGHRPVTLDLTGLGFVASVGVGLLLEAARAARERRATWTSLLPRAGPARRLLDLTGLAAALQGNAPPQKAAHAE